MTQIFFKEKITISEKTINAALYDFYIKHKGIRLGKIKYKFNKSTGQLIYAKAKVLEGKIDND